MRSNVRLKETLTVWHTYRGLSRDSSRTLFTISSTRPSKGVAGFSNIFLKTKLRYYVAHERFEVEGGRNGGRGTSVEPCDPS